jgi:hypothetical protein
MFTTGRDERGIAIPPGKQSFEVTAECTSECTSSLWPAEGVNAMATILHTHLLGREIWTQVIRNGVELAPLASQDHYDFNYQEFQKLATPYKLYPGDKLVTHCIYDSSSRTEVTYGGLGTRNEMCYDFFLYWPLQPRGICVDITDPAGTPASKAVFCSGTVLPKPSQPPSYLALPAAPPRICEEQKTVEEGAASRVTVAALLFAICSLLLLV